MGQSVCFYWVRKALKLSEKQNHRILESQFRSIEHVVYYKTYLPTETDMAAAAFRPSSLVFIPRDCANKVESTNNASNPQSCNLIIRYFFKSDPDFVGETDILKSRVITLFDLLCSYEWNSRNSKS